MEQSPGGGGTVNIPKVGKVKKVYVLVGVAAVGVAVAIHYRNTKAASSTAPADNTAATDAAALGDTSYLPYGDTSSGGGSAGSTSDQIDNGPPFTNNAAWAQYATAYMVGTLGKDPSAVGTDLGAYLDGAKVTQAQAEDIRTATGYAGPPPVTGPNGYPPSINVGGSVAGTGSAPGAVHPVASATASSITVKWSHVTGASGYAYTVSGPDGYHKTGKVTGTSFTVSGLKGGASYTVSVHATNSHGNGPTATLSVKTAAAGHGSHPAAYASVRVVRAAGHPLPWNSTLSGIAHHYGYGSNWQAVWDDPKNNALRAKRHSPDAIQPGDIVHVKKK